MKIRFPVLIILLGVVLFSCGNGNGSGGTVDDQTAAQEKLWDEVMAIHDEVMPRMSDINRTRKQLRDYLTEEESIPPGTKEELQTIVNRLDGAEESMWNWMNELKTLQSLREEKGHEEIVRYLEEERKDIRQIREDIDQAIREGENARQQLAE